MTTIRIQRYIALLSIILFIGKVWAWYITNSVTILTDALESTVNVIAGLIGLYSIILAAKPRDLNHPYGHGKAEFVSSAVEGSLIAVAGILIAYEAIIQLITPRPLRQLDIGIVIIAITGAVNFTAGMYAVRMGRKHKSLIVESAGNHLKSDAYSTLAIVVGLGLLLFTGWNWLDSVVALIFAVVIIVTGYRVVRRSLSGIMDEADEKLIQEVIDLLQRNRKDGWIDLHNLRVIEYGNRMHIDAHLTLPWYYKVSDAEVEIHAVEDLISKHYSNKVELFIHIDACQDYSCKLCAMQECAHRKRPYTSQTAWNMDNVWADSKHGKENA
ncbi:MAG: cation diffusion facilitator family transporter [Taibaiella sp.]|nr:cation diffusion facilitator family transporter [Taibaiella sp.]